MEEEDSDEGNKTVRVIGEEEEKEFGKRKEEARKLEEAVEAMNLKEIKKLLGSVMWSYQEQVKSLKKER